MALWQPRPRGQLVRSAPEWFNTDWYISGGVLQLLSGQIGNVGLYNQGLVSILVVLYSLILTTNQNSRVAFNFLNGVGGASAPAFITQAPSEPGPSGSAWLGTPFTGTTTNPFLFLPAGQVWFWPYSYPIATIEAGYSFRVQMDNQGSSTANISVQMGWIEGAQG